MVSNILFIISFILIIYIAIKQFLRYRKLRTFSTKDKAVTSLDLGLALMITGSVISKSKENAGLVIMIIGAIFTFGIPFVMLIKTAFTINK